MEKKTKRASRVLLGKRVALVTPAEGVTGFICGGLGSEYFFRVYEGKGEFTDYDLLHDDLEVTIAPGAMASLYRCGADSFLDHSPQVLGLDTSGKQAQKRARK